MARREMKQQEQKKVTPVFAQEMPKTARKASKKAKRERRFNHNAMKRLPKDLLRQVRADAKRPYTDEENVRHAMQRVEGKANKAAARRVVLHLL